MRLAVPKEIREGETRVAATPESVKKLKGLGLDVVVQAGAGAGARISDADYAAAGATVAPDAASTLSGADIVLKVRGPSASEISQLKNGAVLAALSDSSSAQLLASARVLLENEPAFLQGMDAIAFQYDSESSARVAELKRIELLLTAMTLTILALEGLFVFRPAVQILRKLSAGLARRRVGCA